MRAVISRIIAPIIAALAAWLTAAGLDLDPGFVTAATEAATFLLLAVFGLVYGVAHKLIDRKVNPADDAAG
jgi:hypothetical protein